MGGGIYLALGALGVPMARWGDLQVGRVPEVCGPAFCLLPLGAQRRRCFPSVLFAYFPFLPSLQPLGSFLREPAPSSYSACCQADHPPLATSSPGKVVLAHCRPSRCLRCHPWPPLPAPPPLPRSGPPTLGNTDGGISWASWYQRSAEALCHFFLVVAFPPSGVCMSSQL